MEQQPNLVTLTEGITGFSVPLAGDLTVSYEASVIVSLRQVMAYLGEGQLSQQEMLRRLAMPRQRAMYGGLLGLGLFLGPNISELDAYDDAVHNGNQVKMPPKIELTALGSRLNEAGKQLYQQCTMTTDAYIKSLEEASMHDTE